MTEKKRTELQNRLRAWADALEEAPRNGNETDEPEGSRVVLISDTMARQLVHNLRLMATELTPGAKIVKPGKNNVILFRDGKP